MNSDKRHQPTAVGRRLRHLRHAQGKTLAVVAGLAGISTGHLCRLETGAATLDRLSLIVALAEVLQIHPAELIKLQLRAPDTSHLDSSPSGMPRTRPHPRSAV